MNQERVERGERQRRMLAYSMLITRQSFSSSSHAKDTKREAEASIFGWKLIRMGSQGRSVLIKS